jgi:oligoendopeptidase F
MKNNSFKQTAWKLTDLVPSNRPEELDAAIEKLEKLAAEFEKVRPELTDRISSSTFYQIVRQLEAMQRQASLLMNYSFLWFAEDTQNQAAQTLLARIDQLGADLSNRILFFSLWWKALPDAEAKRLMADAGDYLYWLEEMRHFKPHTLSEPEEKIINIKNVTGASALNNLYDSITNRYTFKMEIDGEIRDLTRGEVMMYARHYNPDLRAKAFQELYRVYGNDGPILGQMYQIMARDWRNENVTLRHFASPIASRNLANDIPDEVIDTLLDVCHKNAPVFQRFFHLKAKWLGMEKLRRYDIYAPVAQSDKVIPFEKAAEMVMDSFREFDPEFAEMAARVPAENHLDSEVRKGKRGGAFCCPVAPDITPWVHISYQGHADDASTMAHELGHAIHSMLSSHHSLFTYHSCLPLAETASTFGEMMFVDKLLKEEPDESIRRDTLFRQVDDAYATIMRQAYFAMFERQSHEMVQNGASVDELSAAYLENLKDQFGDSIDVSDEFKWEWVSIPHFYNTPFYVYAYAFGQLLVLSLYKQFKEEGDSFKPRYKKLLAAGGSKSPAQVLAEAGIDIRSAAFWQGGFDVISGMIDQLAAMPLPEKK